MTDRLLAATIITSGMTFIIGYWLGYWYRASKVRYRRIKHKDAIRAMKAKLRDY